MKGLDAMERAIIGNLVRGDPKGVHRTVNDTVRATDRLVARGLCIWVAVQDPDLGLVYEAFLTKLGAEVYAWDRAARGDAA